MKTQKFSFRIQLQIAALFTTLISSEYEKDAILQQPFLQPVRLYWLSGKMCETHAPVSTPPNPFLQYHYLLLMETADPVLWPLLHNFQNYSDIAVGANVYREIGYYCSSAGNPDPPLIWRHDLKFNPLTNAFEVKNLHVLRTQHIGVFLWTWEEISIISLYKINLLVFIIETECVYCAVRTGSLCVLCGSENKQRLFPYTALTDWFL
jgi:hypothetical protein